MLGRRVYGVERCRKAGQLRLFLSRIQDPKGAEGGRIRLRKQSRGMVYNEHQMAVYRSSTWQCGAGQRLEMHGSASQYTSLEVHPQV